jgi:hypothetical protein
MGHGLIRSCGLLVAIGLAWHSARAGDRKTERFQEPQERMALAQKAHASSSAQFELARPLLITDFQGRSSVTSDRRSPYLIEKSDSDTQAHGHKSLILFQMNSKVGQIKVKPLIGHVTGAQCSIGF